MAVPITIPLINTNEPEALLASLHVTEGQEVAAGDLLCTLETTKSTVDLHAEAAGFLVGLQFAEGEMLRAGDILAHLADSPDWATEGSPREAGTAQDESAIPEGLRITRPALRLARQHHLDLADLPGDILVTESVVRAALQGVGELAAPLPEGEFDPTAILIYGAGGHGKSVLDLLGALGTYHVVGFIDDGLPPGSSVMGLKVLGGKEALASLLVRGVRLAANAVGGIGNLDIRRQVFKTLIEAGCLFPALAHPSAVIEASASLSPGVQVFPLAYLGSEVQVGFGTIVNTGAIVSHECVLGDLVNISPGAILAGGVKVGEGALIGMGATVNLQVTVGAGARVGNGATVKAEVPPKGIVPAGTIWPKG